MIQLGLHGTKADTPWSMKPAVQTAATVAPDPYDYILSRLERNTSKDRDDADYLFGTKKLDSQALRERYQQELRPYLAKENWHDKTLELWIEIFEAPK